MATNLIVRNLDDGLVQALKERAAAHGHSAEAEHREILARAIRLSALGADTDKSIQQGYMQIFAGSMDMNNRR
jgi:plasmid stability protein